MERVIEHPIIGKVIYIKRLRARAIRVSVSAGNGVRVSLPFFCRYAEAENFVNQNVGKIEKMKARLEARLLDKVKVKVNNLTQEQCVAQRKRARIILMSVINELSEKMNQSIPIHNARGEIVVKPFSYNRLFLKNNVSNWGSCSVRRNINLNINLINLPEDLMRYVILHELCHLVYMNHGKEFHNLLNKVCGGREKELSKQLRKYTLR